MDYELLDTETSEPSITFLDFVGRLDFLERNPVALAGTVVILFLLLVLLGNRRRRRERRMAERKFHYHFSAVSPTPETEVDETAPREFSLGDDAVEPVDEPSQDFIPRSDEPLEKRIEKLEDKIWQLERDLTMLIDRQLKRDLGPHAGQNPNKKRGPNLLVRERESDETEEETPEEERS